MIGRHEIFRLFNDRLGPCVSLYMPTRPAELATHEDLTRYQNLLRGVENDLILRGCTAANADELLADAKALIDDAAFWRTDGEGLALFLAPDFFVSGRLPCAVRTSYRIGRRFHVRPLLPLVDATRRFYILALNQDSARFFEATPHSMSEIPLDAPSEAPAMSIGRRQTEEPRKRDRGAHSTSQATSLARGHSAIRADREEADLMHFLRSVDRQIHDQLRDQRVPLVLACVGFLASLYEGVNSYGRLLPVKVPGSPVNWSTEELHAHAARIVKPYLEQDRTELLNRFRLAANAQLASNGVATIATAADEARIEILFVADNGECSEDFEPEDESSFFDPAGDDLIEIVAGKTLLGGGSLCIVEKDSMPGGRSMAAIFRSSAATAN